MKINLIVSVSVICFISACCQNISPQKQFDRNLNSKQVQAELIDANRKAMETENLQIDSLVKAKNWNMQQTQTGLRYLINKENPKGKNAKQNLLAEINYEIKLIDGTVAYSSKNEGVKKFKIGTGNVEGGLEEGILLMREGEKYTFIMPSHLAHGLIGDQDKIPAKATLIYEVELKKIENLKN